MSDTETVIRITADTDDLERDMEAGGRAVDRMITRIKQRGEALKRVVMRPTVDVTDRATGRLRSIQSLLGGLKSVRKITIEAVDRASSVVKGIAQRLTNPLALLGAGAGAYGIGKLTVGAAMGFETQMVSMEHWLKGNKEKAQEFVSWLDVLAAKTPFEMDDIFPAGARSIGVSEGDLSIAKRLMQLSADMAGLTPGKTIGDAMEAIADAQMGEFERLKEFNMKFTKEKMDAAGGFIGFLKQAESKFAGGAEKLSATAKGRISTITDVIKTQFRSAGQGMLEAIGPRLKKITDWFDNNKDAVQAWRENLVRMGRDAAEQVLSWGEHFLGRLKSKFEDPGFSSLPWDRQLIAILDEAAAVVVPKATAAGLAIGASFGESFAQGVLDAITKDQRVALIMGVWVGSKVPGNPVVKIAVGGAIAATPAAVDLYEGKKTEARYKGWGTAAEDIYNRLDAQPADQPLIEGGELGAAPTKKAFGDIVTSPTRALIGEAGPEAIIPLSGRMRNRGLSLWQETGKRLGVVPHAEGGIFGGFFGNIMDSIKSFFSNDTVSNASNYTESSAIALESTNMGMEKAVEGIHDNYSKKIAQADDFEEAYKARGIGHGARDLANKYGKATKMFSRVALPLGVFSSIAQIMAAEDKRAAIVRELGSTAGAIVMGALMGAGTGALVGGGVISPLTAMLGTVIGAGLGAFGGQAAATKFSSWARHHATGGIMTSPHIGLVGEAGPEAIIPLSQRYRNRAMGLWQQVGNSLGAQPQMSGAGGITVQHNGDIIVNGGGDIDYDALAKKIGWYFVDKIKNALENR